MGTIRAAEPADLPAITDLDRRLTGETKATYWQQTLERYAGGQCQVELGGEVPPAKVSTFSAALVSGCCDIAGEQGTRQGQICAQRHAS